MKIEIQASNFKMNWGLRRFIRRRLDLAVGPLYPKINSIQVHLSDTNGPRGGADKRCRVLIGLPNSRDVLIEDTRGNIYSAIRRAAERARQSVLRRLGKQRVRGAPKLLVPSPA